LPKRQERIQARRNKIIRFLERTNSTGVETGKTVVEIAHGIKEDLSVIRVDLEALRAEGVQRDSKRMPNLYWKPR